MFVKKYIGIIVAMYPSEYTYEYLKQIVRPLRDNYIYRVSDSMNSDVTHQINKEMLTNEKYKGTILRKVLVQRQKNNQNKKKILYDVATEHSKENNIELYDNTHLVVHIRLGDIVSQFESISDHIISTIHNRIKENPEITKVILVTALHYGQPCESNSFYSSGTYSYKKDSHIQNINVLLGFIKKIMHVPVTVQSSDIDVDLCKLVFTKHLITTKGGFSLLIGTLHKMFVENGK